MDNLFKAQKKTSSVNVVINSIKELLLEKRLMPGDKIPNEMEIATGLGVSRGTVREALKILSAYGIIDIKVGNGTYISSEANKESIDPMLFSMLLLKADNDELSEFRKLIECDIIRLIFSHKDINQSEIQQIKNNIKEIQLLVNNPTSENYTEKTFKNDMEFHKLLGQASKNIMAEKVYNFILDIFSYSIKISHKNDELGKYTLESHTKIFDGIETDNIESAIESVNHSIDIWKSLQSQIQK